MSSTFYFNDSALKTYYLMGGRREGKSANMLFWPKVSCLNSSSLIDNHFIFAFIYFYHFLLMYNAPGNQGKLSVDTMFYLICIISLLVDLLQIGRAHV